MSTFCRAGPGGSGFLHSLVNSMFSIADKLENVRQRIQKATLASGRPESAVTLLAVSKTKSAEMIHEAIMLGMFRFGENYLSEAIEKQEALRELCSPEQWHQLEWHFIGPIQSNKTRLIAEHFDWVQGVDRVKIARRLNEQRPDNSPPLNVCIQINIDAEATKAGIPLADLSDLAEQIAAFPRLCLRGLMTIPAAAQSSEDRRQRFQEMRESFEVLQARYESVDTLSMGMSADLEDAIACGSTMVRVGTALFGQRN